VLVCHMSEIWGLGCGETATQNGRDPGKVSRTCPAPECGKEFAFELGETRVFELPLLLFERRHFYRSELS
jgi:hypothetical protein